MVMVWRTRRWLVFLRMKKIADFVPVSTPVREGHGMARGRKTSLTIHLTPAERRTLLAWQRATTISAGHARRDFMILTANLAT
jgi:hypothetical protein